MQNKFRNCLQVLFISLLAAFVLTGCTKEDLSECYKPRFRLTVKAFDADNKEVGAEQIKDITLYIFDKEKAFIASQNVNYAELITLDYPYNDHLTVVVWANGKQGHQTMPTLKRGDHLETAFVSLIYTKAALPVAGSPDDLFFGTIDMEADASSENIIRVIRKTSGVVVTARYLKEYVGATDDDFHYVLRKSSDKLDFYGKPNGTDVSYMPAAEFDKEGDYVSSLFNIFSTDSDIKIDIYYHNVLQTTIISDDQGKPLRAVEGRLLNVFVSFKGSVSVSVTPWGEKQIWKDFN